MAISQPFKVAWRPTKAMSIGRGLLPFATQFHVECLLASCFGMLRHTSSTLPLVLTMKFPHIDMPEICTWFIDWKAEERKAVVLEREIEQHVQAAFETAKLPRLVSLYTSFQSYADLHGTCNLWWILTLLTPLWGHQKNGVQVPWGCCCLGDCQKGWSIPVTIGMSSSVAALVENLEVETTLILEKRCKEEEVQKSEGTTSEGESFRW